MGTLKLKKPGVKPVLNAEPAPPAPTGWVAPGEFALCRKVAGGDWAAGALLHSVAVMWKLRKNKLTRAGKEWLAMPRCDWARRTGLSDAEMKERWLGQSAQWAEWIVCLKAARMAVIRRDDEQETQAEP